MHNSADGEAGTKLQASEWSLCSGRRWTHRSEQSTLFLSTVPLRSGTRTELKETGQPQHRTWTCTFCNQIRACATLKDPLAFLEKGPTDFSYLSTTVQSSSDSTAETHWSRPACHVDWGYHWWPTLSTHSLPSSIACEEKRRTRVIGQQEGASISWSHQSRPVGTLNL